MQRVLEPELMEQEAQVKAYAEADFSIAHGLFIELIQRHLDNPQFAGAALDMGCGPGDISRRFAAAFPKCRVDAVDGSITMLDYGKLMLPKELIGRVNFVHAKLPEGKLPVAKYALIFSNSLLHHLPEPQVLWQSIKRYAEAGTPVYIMDLLRPQSIGEARKLQALHTRGEPDILQQDFYHSLLAAFTLDEIAVQLAAADLPFLLEQISDRHVFIRGTIEQ